MFKVEAIALTRRARKVGMIENVIAQTVGDERIIDIVAAIGNPVVVKFFRTENKNGFVAVLIIFYYRKSGECFAKTDGIGKDTAVILFLLVDDGESGITLEIIEFLPDDTRLEAGGLVRQYIL